MSLTMVVYQGLFLVGERIAADKLSKPRVFTIIEGGKKIQLSPLPGIPGVITFPNTAIRYGVPEREESIYKLYKQVTAPGIDPNS